MRGNIYGREEGKRLQYSSSFKITDDMRTQAASDYVKFMTTDTYKQYTKDYDTFIKKIRDMKRR